jgi:hypothetical protein
MLFEVALPHQEGLAMVAARNSPFHMYWQQNTVDYTMLLLNRGSTSVQAECDAHVWSVHDSSSVVAQPLVWCDNESKLELAVDAIVEVERWGNLGW